MGAVTGAIDGWRNPAPQPREMNDQQRLYLERWSLYDGSLFADLHSRNPYRDDPAIYQNTKLLWKHAESVGDFWAAVIYRGALSTDGKPLPDGSTGAIPIEPQAGTDERNAELLKAISALYVAWNWQQQMSLRPLYASVLGDCLTELVDDTGRRFVYPQIVWPGYVKEIELDYVGNVRRYVLEYPVTERDDRGNVEKSYLFTKEVTPEEFRYFHDGQPYDHYGTGAVVENVYGFVPAIWDRHRIGAPGLSRGRSALDGTRQALLVLNSIFSHALDHQRKIFFAPLMVTGRAGGRRREETVDLGTPPTTAKDLAESFKVVGVPEGANLLQPNFNIGETRALLEDLRIGILDETPEARFYPMLREMQNVTAPGAKAAIGDVENRFKLAHPGYDIQTVKLFQMAIAMCGHNVQTGAWAIDEETGRQRRLSPRQMAFARFDLTSYAAGDLDMTILERPLVAPSEQERAELAVVKESPQTLEGLMLAGWTEDQARSIIEQRQTRDLFAMSTGAFGVDPFGEEGQR